MNMVIRQRFIVAIITIIVLFISFPQSAKSTREAFVDVSANYWASQAIQLAVQQGIVKGYPDGTFKPEAPVREAEFLAMLLRAYPEVTLPKVEGQWYEPYYALSVEYNWPAWYENNVEQYNRGRMAQVVAATQGMRLDVEDAVQYLLDEGLSTGKTSATVAGYGMAEPLKRAEAVAFIFRMQDMGLGLHEAKDVSNPPVTIGEGQSYDRLQVRGVQLGDNQEQLLALLGEPERVDASEYGFEWYIYNEDYRQYAQIGLLDGRVVALYTNSADWETKEGVTFGSSLTDVNKAYGEGLEYIRKGNTRFLVNEKQQREAPVYHLEDSYVTFFIDIHEGNTVTAIQVIDEQVEHSLQSFFGEPSAELHQSFELQMLDLANVVRLRYGKGLLTWDDLVATTARKHSQDMSEGDYFSHTNLQGKDPFDRMRDDGVNFRRAAENIAAGSSSAIFAHEGLMNSKGHRDNILLDDVTRLGVGIYFGDGSYSLYYTQKFYKPM